MSQINLQQLWISYAIQNPPPFPGSPAEVIEAYNKEWEDYKRLMMETNPTLNRSTHPDEDDYLIADEPQEYEEYVDYEDCEEYEGYEEYTGGFDTMEHDVFQDNSGADASISDEELVDASDLLEEKLSTPSAYIADQCTYLIEQIEHLHGILLTSLDGYRRCYDFCSFKAQEALLLSKAEELLQIHELSVKALKKKTEVFGYLGSQY